MKNQPNKVPDIRRLSAKAEPPVLNGRTQETLNQVEGNVIAHNAFLCADAQSDYCEHSVLQCVHLKGQVCFHCLSLLGHPIEKSGVCVGNKEFKKAIGNASEETHRPHAKQDTAPYAQTDKNL